MDGGAIRPQQRQAPAVALGKIVEHNLLSISAVLLLAGSLGWCWLIYSQFRSSVLLDQPPPVLRSVTTEINSTVAKSDPIVAPAVTRKEQQVVPSGKTAAATRGADQTASLRTPRAAARGESAAGRVARDFAFFQPTREAERDRTPAKEAASLPVRVASLETDTPQLVSLHSRPDIVAPHVPNIDARTSLVSFESAPFPYHGNVPGSNRPFMNAGERDHRGHVNFRGRVLWESQTFSDNHVLLHIPPGFDPDRPAVMVVFFHGHGANLASDVRDRQRVPAQITAAGMNAVLVAPQFAVDAADSSAGKFWEPNGFKRFLDEAAGKLASLYGDPHSAKAFAKMPVVLVAYSGGFGPTLSVLDHGGARSRIRGLVLLDALYAGIDQFAEWIASNRSAFFVSSYTPHTAHHNAYLERLLSERSVPYGSELRHDHLQGMVAFLATGAISHRDFVNHAWANYPIKDILVRMDDVVDPKSNVGSTALSFSAAEPAKRD